MIISTDAKTIAAAALLGQCALGALPALAAEYAVDSDYHLSARVNDNYRMVLEPQSKFDELSGANFSADYKFSRNTEVSSLSAAVDLDAGYFNIDAYNTFDQRVATTYRRGTERGSWNLGANYNRDSIRVTESTTAGSGFFEQSDKRSEAVGINAGWFTQLTERHSINLSLFGSDQSYDADALTDYQYAGSSALWQFVLNERLRLQSELSYNMLDSKDENVVFSPLIFDAKALGVSPGVVPLVVASCQNFPTAPIVLSSTFECLKNSNIDNEQTTINAQVGIVYLFSERLTLDLLVGRSTVDTNSLRSYSNRSTGATDNVPDQTIDRKNDNTNYTAELSYDAENLDYTLSASARDSATSSGILSLNTRLAFDIDWSLSERNALLFRVSWYDQQTSSDSDQVFNNREFYQGLLRYSRRLTEHWAVSAQYRYYDQRRSGVKEHANSNEALLTLRWRPTTLKWSR